MSLVSSLRLAEARALSALGQRRAALARVDALLASAPSHGGALFQKARFAREAGEEKAAEQLLRQLVSREPNYPNALWTLAELAFPGPPYRDVLANIHEELRPAVYLEIGVELGFTLQVAERHQLPGRGAIALGIDPRPRPRHKPEPSTRLFAETSDAFFGRHPREELLGERRVDLAFIDGMHLFEYVLRDFVNVERWCHAGSTIVLHDCLPISPEGASRERHTAYWVGDTWKAVECLIAARPDLHIRSIPCYPSGLVVIQNLDPGSTLLSEKLGALEQEYLDKPYPYAPGVWPSHYGIVENTPAGLAEALSHSGARRG